MSILRRLSIGFTLPFAAKRFYQKPTAAHIVNVERPKRPSYLDNGTLYYDIAVPQDREIVMDFMQNHFRKDGPFEKFVQVTENEVADFYWDIVNPCLTSGLSLLAFDGNDLKSILLNHIVDIPADNQQLDFNDPLFSAVKADFTEDIKNGPYKFEPTNQMYAYICALQRDFIRIFPPKSRVLDSEIAAVSRDMRGKGITLEMALKAFKYSRDTQGCEFATVTAISPVLAKIAKAEEHKVARVLMFEDFKAGGEPVFGDKLQGGGALIIMEFANMTNI